MRRVGVFVGVVLLIAGCDATAPRPFTLGPGCWTINRVDLGGMTATIKAHYPMCPDSLAAGQTLWHWDTTWVDH